ncbi:MAG: ribosomal protein S18-alanine N-acetyltransferase [Vicinamibacterales bacterium]
MTPIVEPLAGPADLDGVLEVEAASFHNPTTRAWYESELTRPDVCHVYVIRIPGCAVAGFCAFWRVADEIHINNLAVRPELRGSGLGRTLLAAVLDAARALGAPRATLEVRRSNTAALRLYEGAGFRLAAVRPGYYTQPIEDALVLWREPPRAGGPGGT